MPATIDDLQQELESLNASMSNLLTFQQEAAMMAQQAGQRGGPGGEDKATGTIKSLITGTIQRAFVNPWASIKDLWATSIQLGVNALTKLDQIQWSNFDSGRSITTMMKNLDKQGHEEIGNIYNNLQTMLYAQEQGIDLSKSSDVNLRNQLTMLDKAGAQGKMLLQFTKDLRTQGFSQEDVRKNLEYLANIGFESVQSAQSQAKMLKRMEQSMGITSLADANLSKNLLDLHSSLVMHAPQEFKFAVADMINLIRLPQGTDQIVVLAAINAQLGDVEGQMNRMADAFGAANTQGEKDRIKNDMYSLLQNIGAVIRSEAKTVFPDRAQRGPERGLLLMESLFSETAQLNVMTNAVNAGIENSLKWTKAAKEDPDTYYGAEGWIRVAQDTTTNLMRMNDKIEQEIARIAPEELRDALFKAYFQIARGVAFSAGGLSTALDELTKVVGLAAGGVGALARAAGLQVPPEGLLGSAIQPTYPGDEGRWDGMGPVMDPGMHSAPGSLSPAADPTLQDRRVPSGY